MDRDLSHLWASLDRKTTVSRRELVLSLALCALSGMVLGMLLSPRKHLVIGCNNNEVIHADAPGSAGESEANEE